MTANDRLTLRFAGQMYKCNLELLPVEDPNKATQSLTTYPFAYDAPLFFFITGLFHRNMRKYRERGYRFTVLEVGIILHNFYLVAEALQLGCCGLGSNFDSKVSQMLDLNDRIEHPLISFVIGHIK